jgi:hypothetical protein
MRINVSAEGEMSLLRRLMVKTVGSGKGKTTRKSRASEKATAALRHGVELPGKLFGLHEMNARGNQVELIGRENIDAINYCALRLTLRDGYTTKLYVDLRAG